MMMVIPARVSEAEPIPTKWKRTPTPMISISPAVRLWHALWSGAGIGGGGVGGTGNINITGGTSLGISLGGGAGIGSGYSGAVKNININNAAAAMGRSANYFKDEKNVLSQIENEMVLWAVQTLDFCEDYVSDLPVLDENTLNEIADQQCPTLNPDDYDYMSRERFGSGIGCGGEGSVEDITIKDSFVAAQGGRASASIGSFFRSS